MLVAVECSPGLPCSAYQITKSMNTMMNELKCVCFMWSVKEHSSTALLAVNGNRHQVQAVCANPCRACCSSSSLKFKHPKKGHVP